MSRRSIAASCFLMLVTLAAGIYFWNSQGRLRFSPEPDSSRTFIISLKISSSSSNAFYPAPAALSAVLDAQVSGREKGLQSRLTMALPYFRVSEGGRLQFDSEKTHDYDQRGQVLQRLMSAGVTTWVDSRGRQTSPTEFVDKEAFRLLAAELPTQIRAQLEAYRRLGAFPQSAFPTIFLKEGRSWKSLAFEANGMEFPSMHFQITSLNSDRLTISLAPGQESDALQLHGFIELERSTGWPLRGRFIARQTGDVQQNRPSLLVHFSLYQPGYEFELRNADLINLAYLSLAPFSINREDPDTQSYFFISQDKSALDKEQRIKVLEDSMLWFPPLPESEDHGLFVDTETLIQANIMPHTLQNMRLLDNDGKQILSDRTVDPRFNFRDLLDNTQEPVYRAPFSLKGLTEAQLNTIDRLELDMEFSLTGERVDVQIDQQGNVEGANHTDYQVDILQWNSGRALLRLSRKDGEPMAVPNLIPVQPLSVHKQLNDKQPNNSQPLPEFRYRVSNSQVEALRSSYLEAGHDPENSQEFQHYLEQQLYRLPPDGLNRDRIIEIQAPESFEKMELSFLPTVVERRTFTIPNAGETLRGGSVIGSMFLSQWHLPELDFPEVNINDIKVSGVESGQLILTLPEQGRNRCSVELMDSPHVNGSPLLLQWPLQAGWISDHSRMQLVSEHGQEFFYDVTVALKTQCITRIESHTEVVDESAVIQRIDPYTIELSEELFAEIAEINAIDAYSLTDYPLIGRNKDGQPLVILSHLEAYQGDEAGTDSRRIRFWGELAEISYPAIKFTERRTLEFHFPPMP